MTISLRQLLAFKKTLLNFARECVEEEQDEYLATIFHEESCRLQDEVNQLVGKCRKLGSTKKTIKKIGKKRGTR